MQRRKVVDSKSASSHTANSSSLKSKKYVLPTTATTANAKIMLKSKHPQQKRKFNLISFLVQFIVCLLIGTSFTMIYIAVKKSGGASNANTPIEKQVQDLSKYVKNDPGLIGEDVSDIKSPGESHHYDSNNHVDNHMGDDDKGSSNTNGITKYDDDDGAIAKQSIDTKTLPDPEKVKPKSKPRRKRTTEEANAYMAKQPSFSIDGEIALKKKLLPLYELQEKNLEENSPIITRWVGEKDEDGNEIKYWIPSSTATKEDLKAFKEKKEELEEVARQQNVLRFPELHDKERVEEMEGKGINIGEGHAAKSISHTTSSSSSSSSTGSSGEYPQPAPEGTHVILEPTFGKHRKNVDAVFALAEGYDLKIYLLFIESLKATGFNGDLVISVSALGSLKTGVEEYLRSNQKGEDEDGVNVVAYTVTWTCYTGDGEIAEGAKEGTRKCELVGMYGEDADEHAVTDPREARPVATARFELYWAWTQYYGEDNWIMLIDSRDAHFQLNPFEGLKRNVDGDEGLLYFFAENAEESNIGKSNFNSRWLREAYGAEKVQSFFDQPIICSGSTMGQQIAMEPYLRAMVAQFDDTNCKLKGCDQGFHNYLYYSNSLSNLKGIKDVKVFAQGTGIINNLGVLRSKPLREWGLLNDENVVLNWDGSVSAVAHQFDRDDELNTHLKEVRKVYEDEFKTKKSTGADDSKLQFASPAPKGTHVIMQPTFGKHRSHVDAIFGLAEGYDIRIYLLFIESLIKTGFNGDLVLSVSALDSLKNGVEDYLRSHHKEENEDGLNVVVYTVTWTCYNSDGTVADGANEGVRKCELVDMYGNDTDNRAIKDPREARPVATARFELYWAWSQYYDKHNWIMLIDTRDTHFQLNPFATIDHQEDKDIDEGLLYFFAENAQESNIGKSSFNSRWLREAYGAEKVQSFFDRPIICSGSTMGQQIAMEPYLRAMVAQFDDTHCKLKGCDQGFHNYLYYSNTLLTLKGVKEVIEFEQGKGIINNLGVLRSKPLREWGLLNDENVVLNWDGSVSAVAHQFDRDDELNKHLKKVRQGYTSDFWASKN